MCEFHYDFVNNEPFYYCDHEYCEFQEEKEEGFLSLRVGCGKLGSLSVMRIFKLDPKIKTKVLLSWMNIRGDFTSPHLLYRGQQLSMERTLSSYGMADYEFITVSTVWPHFATISLAPRIELEEDPQAWPQFVNWNVSGFLNHWELQADENSTSFDELLSRVINARTTFLDRNDLWLFELFENFFQTIYWLRKCDSKKDFAAIAHLSYKLFMGRTISHQCKNFLLQKESILQNDFEEYIKSFRNIFDVTHLALSSPLVRKMYELYTYLLVQGFLSKFGMEISDKEFHHLARRSGKSYKSPTSLLVCIVDSTLYICEKLIDFRKTGDPTAFIHTDSTYSAWSDEADKILELAPFTSNLEAHGTSYFSFVADLNDMIERGEAIRKHSKTHIGVESTALGRKLQNLHLLKNVEITRRASQKEREAPFGVLVHGASSVGKSTFTKMLYYYYGSLHGLEKDDHFRYVRNPADEYWSNFDSSKWCIQMDDIAFLLPSKSSEVDPTLKEMLNVVNNVPYVPPQAALEDKGKTPVLAKLVVATSNAKDLNAHEYFYCPLAVRRRLPYVVHVTPKTEYLHNNKKFLNTEAIPDFSGSYPDFWTITVQKIVPIESNGRDRAKLVDVEKFDNVLEFLEHYGRASMEHLKTQDRSHNCDAGMRNISVCPLCFKTSDKCVCLQVDEISYLNIFKRFCFEAACSYFVWMLSWSWIVSYVKLVARVRFARKCIARLSNMLSTKIQIQVYALMNGAPVSVEYKYALLSLSAMGIVLYMYSRPSKKFTHMVPQGNKFSTTEQDLHTESTSNVWYDPVMELSTFDVPAASLSNATVHEGTVRDLFAQNCIRLHVRALDHDYSCRTGGVFVRGQTLLVNGHVFKHGTKYRIDIQNMTKQGLSSNHALELKRTDIKFGEDRDLACFQVMSMPPHKDLTKFWNVSQIPVTRILSIKRDNSGTVGFQNVFGVNFASEFPIEALHIKVPMYVGKGEEPTQPGDCGSLGVAITPKGPVILGIHTVGHNNMCGFPHVTKERLEKLVALATTIKHVDGGGQPVLSLNSDVQLVAPHHKSLFRFLPEGTARIYGSFPGFRPKPKSRVVRTPICKVILEHFDTTVKHDKPAMDGWEPWRKNVVEMVHPTVNYDRDVLFAAKQMFMDEILSSLPSEWEKELVFLSRKATVNGLPGVKFIDRINCNSSMGHPWNTTKKKFLIPDSCQLYPEGVDFVPEVWNEVDKIEALYSAGQRAMPVYTGHLKDEPTPFAKCEAKKTRVFTGSSIPFSLVVRKYLLSFVRLLQKNKFVFEAGPGLVVQSTEWTDVYHYLSEFGVDRMVAGDYAKFDKRMISDFILAAFDIIVGLHERAGFSSEELQILRGIACDTAFPIVNMNGDLVEFYGTNPSGHPLTVIINSLVNSLYMRYAYVQLGGDAGEMNLSFKQHVRLFTYGDDNIMGISSEVPWFNHTSIQSALHHIGVEYTMADKNAESVPYISISKCSFLKRTWRFDEEVGAYMAPLEEESIHKSLTTWIPSGTIDKYAQTVAVVQSANSEYFFYGKQVFEKHRSFFKQLLLCEPYCHYVTETTLPGWDELKDRFWKASGQLVSTMQCGLGGPHCIKTSSCNNQISAQKVHEQGSPPVTRSTGIFASCGSDADISPQMFTLQSEELVPPETVVSTTAVTGSEETSETVTFIDNAGGAYVDLPTTGNNVALVDSTDDLRLGSFLARPTLIDTFTWSTSDVIGVRRLLEPWFLFLNSAAIKKKIDNYAFLRGTLHVKVLINGTPFQYGALRACYSPLLGWVSDKIRTNSVSDLPLAVPYSQQPGFFIYPQANSGGEMPLRFFLHKNWMDITSANEVQNMGTLTFFVFAPLNVAVTGGSTTVTVRTYAWMSDVELMGSTSELSLQGDEYGVGTVSAPASAVSAIASRLSLIPIIGKFARATEIGASAVSSIATLFGFTNVPVINDVQPLHPMNAPMLASAHIGVPVQKLTLDPKQELSIDPSPHGIGSADELSLAYLKSRESFFGAVNWSTANTAGQQLFNVRISPALWDFVDLTNTSGAIIGKRVYHTPLSYVGAMFKHWRGDLIIRVKIVCTKFHKGRLKISYDPRGNISTSDPDENTVYTQILDIGEKDDIEFVIPYHQDLGWLKHDQTIQDNWSPGGAMAPRIGTDNGILTVRVLNTLTAPSSGSLYMMFFVRGGDNFEFANPTGHIGPDATNVIPNFFSLQSEDTTDIVASRVVIGSESQTMPERYALNFGECIGSLRNILHRSMVFETTPMPSVSDGTFITITKVYKRMPYTPGYDPVWSSTSANRVIAASGTFSYVFNTMPHIAYISGMFLGYRGGVNYTVTPSSDLYGSIDDMRVVRATDSGVVNATQRFISNNGSVAFTASTSSKAYQLNRAFYTQDGFGGMGITSTRTNGSLVFNIPDYNNFNFSLVDPTTYVIGTNADGTRIQNAVLQLLLKRVAAGGTNTTSTLTIQSEISAGPDFTCLHFLCCPTLDYTTGVPTPV
jgi:hypothetical protein